MKKSGFTLAEVLITLGIIGVVAALTIPSLIAKHQRRALEAAFKKSYANFHNAFNLTMQDEPVLFDYDNMTNPAPPLAEAIFSKYTKLKNITAKQGSEFSKNARTYTKQKATIPRSTQNFRSPLASFILPDGSAVSISQNSGVTNVFMDTNGINKGPNAYGHDLFHFRISQTGVFSARTSEAEGLYDEDGKFLEYAPKTDLCSKASTSTINGAACTPFALSDTCPDDPSKTYWECLP